MAEEYDGKQKVKSMLAGGFGGICVVLSGHPFDTVKVRLQTQPLPAAGEKPMYSGAMDCVKKTIAKEGPKGLYKGMGAPLVGTAPIFALSFFGFDWGKQLVKDISGTGSKDLNALQLAAAGGFSGILTTTIMAPGERIKCILQVQQASTGPPKYSGPVDVAKQLYREGGMRSIYKGTVATLMRDVPASAAYFGGYEIIQRTMVQIGGGDRSDLGIGRTLLAGGLAGVCNWIVALPPDVLKSRLQSATDGQFKGVSDVFAHLMKTEGPKALYKGAAPVFVRAFVANSCCFMGYELAMWGLNKAM